MVGQKELKLTDEKRHPEPPGLFATASRHLFGGLARLRGGKRAFHPEGVVFAADLFLVGDEQHAEGSILGQKAKLSTMARLSQALGVPEPLPDALGIAIRIEGLAGPDTRQDLLFVTSSRMPGARHAPLPAPRGFFGQFFTTLWPLRVGGKVRMLALQPPEDRPDSPRDLEGITRAGPDARYRLLIASLEGPWQALGELVLRERVEGEVEEIRFNPWNSADGELRPAGPLMGLRDPAYEGSQDARGAPPERRDRPQA